MLRNPAPAMAKHPRGFNLAPRQVAAPVHGNTPAPIARPSRHTARGKAEGAHHPGPLSAPPTRPRPRRPQRPDLTASDRQTIMVRRAIAAGAGLLILILLVLGVRGC